MTSYRRPRENAAALPRALELPRGTESAKDTGQLEFASARRVHHDRQEFT
jgi:hypothetical protein